MSEHPYIKYAIALVMEDYNLADTNDITWEMLRSEVEKGLNHFSVKPIGDFEGVEKVKFDFCPDKSDAKKFRFLAPNAITSDLQASKLYGAGINVKEMQPKKLEASTKLSQSAMPLAGEFNAFSDKGNAGRGKPSSTVLNEILSLIVTLTPDKPCLQDNGKNYCLIPDLTVHEDIDFIKLFKRIRIQSLESDSMMGNVICEVKSGKTVYKPRRPHIYSGNFPNAPRSTALSSIALLGVIGEMTKESETSLLASRVLDSFKGTNIYKIGYGKAMTFTFNNCIIDLSLQGKLKTIVDSIYWSTLYREGSRSANNNFEYKKFDLFTARFLQLFNAPAFRDFLSYRAEYPMQLQLLFETYFEKIMKIDSKIVHSALEMGKWLNRAAYFAATKENKVRGGRDTDKDKIREIKSKILVELESSILSAKTGDALLSQVVVRIGRLTGLDAPHEAAAFMEKAASGDLELEQAKNMLMAFSRLRSTKALENGNQQGNVEINTESLVEDNSDL